MKPHLPSIRSRIVVLVIACILPASLMAVLLIWFNYQHERNRLIQDTIDTARAMAAVVDRDLGGTEAVLTALATSPSLAHDDLAAFYQQAQGALREQAASNVLLIDQSGRQLLNTRRSFGDELPEYGNPAHLQRVFEAGVPATSELFTGQVTNMPLVTIGVPVRRDGKIVYSLNASILPERLLNILTRQNLSEGRVGVIFDGAGSIVARTRDMDRFLGQKAAPALIQLAGRVREGSVETVTVEGTPVVFAFSRSAESNWTVGIGIPQATLSAQLWQMIGWLIAVTALLLAGSLVLARLIGGEIADAFHRLIEPALKLGSGQPVTVPSISLKEADEIGKALTKASEMLRHAEYLAHHDVLTGLANRTFLNDFLIRQLALCQRQGTHLSVLYIDLDGFKAVNDLHGHAAGDELLTMVASRLTASVRVSDVAARLGGDEFALVLVNTKVQDARAVTAKLVDTLSLPYHRAGGATLSVSASIGVAGYPGSGVTSDALLRRADEAMYKAKALGKQRYAVAEEA